LNRYGSATFNMVRTAALLVALLGAAAAVNVSQWMHDVYGPARLATKTIFDVTLPGTHDSATFLLQQNFAPGTDALLEDIVEVADRFGIDAFPLILGWATSQNLTLEQQLIAGARYIDLRACWSEPTSVDPTAPTGWHTHHMVLGLPISELLGQIASFLGGTPGGELVVIEVTHLYGSNATTQAMLQHMIQEQLGPWLVRGMDFNSTLAALTENNTRNQVLVLLESWNGDGASTGLWPDSLIVGQYADMDQVGPMSAWDQGLIETLGGTGSIFRLWWTLTENQDDIIAGVLDPSKYPSKLIQLADEADSQLLAWTQANRNYTLGNLLVVDDLLSSPVVSFAVQDALRDCLDSAQYRARSASGEDCRSWGIAGNCTTSAFVRSVCPRTCLQC
jgi:hypothetical protein